MFNHIYENIRVLITGHTGFKGSWLTLWLSKLGAAVSGYSLPPPTEPNHFSLLGLGVHSITGDIRDRERLQDTIEELQPEIVFHLAAQPIVRRSYADPIETFSSNVMGTVNLFEAVRATSCVRAVVNVTSDKCYRNREWLYGYRETDPLGGYDPYSASKACTELATSCWRDSFFNCNDYGRRHTTLLSSGRAGNVIGGGDWAPDRLIPDMMRAAGNHAIIEIRNPQAIRPWQHVLEPLSGYLLLGQRLLEGGVEFADAWNFGPSGEDHATVSTMVERISTRWSDVNYRIDTTSHQPHEAGLLELDCSKAHKLLGWTPVWTGDTAIDKTVSWYRAFYERHEVRSSDDLECYITDAQGKHLSWAQA